jgi:pimeloyl-ACP methyl ester carboxylesterase
MRSVELQISLTGSGNRGDSIAASVFLPDPDMLPDRPIVIFASPGGGYARGYFDLRLPGRAGYSQAEHHTGRGFILVAYDHLGAGGSSTAGLETLRIEDIAAADDAAVREIARRLADGTLADGFPPLDRMVRIGIGQSMGAGITILMQGRHRTFDAIAPLGYSAIHTVLPQQTAEAREHDKALFRYSRETDPAELSVAKTSRNVSSYVYPFHWEDVPDEIVRADLGGGFPLRGPMPPWASATIPNCVVAMMAPFFVKEEAMMIDVPVLMGFGERDTSRNPHLEPAAFPNSADISVYVAPGMAHMHNFASTRHRLWDRITDWSAMVSRDVRGQRHSAKE